MIGLLSYPGSDGRNRNGAASHSFSAGRKSEQALGRIVKEIQLAVPANPDSLHLIRTVVATVAARAGFTIDEIDDLRLAIDEAGAYLLNVKPKPGVIRLKVETSSDSLRAVVVSDSRLDSWPVAGAKDGLAWKVLSALTDEAEFVLESGDPALEIAKRKAVSA